MIINPEKLNNTDRYKLMIGSIVPRPIAWVSTMDKAGSLNLAPFSFFTAVSTNPMTLLFCPGWSSLRGRMKDTLYNVRETGEFVINIVDEKTKEAMNLSATEFAAGISEFEWAGVTPSPSKAIETPRVAEAPVAFECVVQQIVLIKEGPGGGAAVFGEVKSIYVRDDLLVNGRIPPERLQPIGRLAGSSYAHINDLFTMNRVPPPT
jgi:flavin reductase (DIM6/NTAB) family NADH-FMN oxidoreductase RutF